MPAAARARARTSPVPKKPRSPAVPKKPMGLAPASPGPAVPKKPKGLTSPVRATAAASAARKRPAGAPVGRVNLLASITAFKKGEGLRAASKRPAPKPKTPDARSTLMSAISGFNRMGLRRKSQQTPLPDASQFSPAQKEDMFSQMKRNIALIRPAIAGGDDEDSSESDWSDSDC